MGCNTIYVHVVYIFLVIRSFEADPTSCGIFIFIAITQLNVSPMTVHSQLKTHPTKSYLIN